MRRGPLALGPGGEFDRLRAIFARLGAAARDLGDDAALVRLGGTTLAVSIDLSLEGVHFRTDWLSFKDIGWRATAAALSDLAAEGARPIGVRSEEHTSELQSPCNLVCRLLLEKKKNILI